MAGKQAKTITPGQMDVLMQHVRGRKDSFRSRVIILLSLRAGLRAAESNPHAPSWTRCVAAGFRKTRSNFVRPISLAIQAPRTNTSGNLNGMLLSKMTDSDPPLSEPQVLARWPLLSRDRLRAARTAFQISWVRGKRGSAWYRATAVEQFIAKELERPCRDHAHAPSLNSEDNGSPENLAVPDIIASGMTPEMVEHIAQASAQRILRKQKDGSLKL